ncbi:MAG: penicillin-binding protein [Patescibacteria group bacterium]|nr:penicillin-binding protein [Patescibacteria group bacterium]
MFDRLRSRRYPKITNSPSIRFTKVFVLSRLATIGFFALIALFLLTGFLFAWYSRDLPRPDKVKRVSGLSTIIYDRKEKPLYDIYHDQNRVPIELSEIPQYLKEATIAIEDKDFYKHQGFSVRGILRAFVNIAFRQRLEGGSTLTQQLVKNTLLTSERTVPRKIKEFILSIEIERRYSKDEILQMYLNEAPYGGTSSGIETAAQTYFGKHAKDLSLTESVILAGMPQSPSYYSPYSGNPKAYIDRASQVARRMKEDGYINKDQEQEIKNQLPGIQFKPTGQNMLAPHFVMYVKEQLIEKFGEKMVEDSGLRVYTTLDLDLQEKAQKVVSEEVEKAKDLKVGNGAALGLDPNSGEILVMVGSKDYFAKDYDGNVNVTLSLRQPGSALKPITYATAFKKGFTPSSLIMDVETHFPGGLDGKDYVPKNYDLKYRGPIQLRYALGNSINVVAVKLLAYVGVKEMLSSAYSMGLTTLEPTDANINRFGLSITLGGGEVRLLELVNSYGVFAANGDYFEPVSILKVTDSKGKVLFEHKKTKGKKVLGEDVAFLISNILSDNGARLEVFGPKSWLYIPERAVAVKTGTTDDKRDNWTVGFVPNFVLGTWVGNNDNSAMNPALASGVSGAAPIWNRIMREAITSLPNRDFTKPDNIVQVEIDAYGGGLPKDGYPTRKEYFKKGTEPTVQSSIYKKIKLSKETGKVANSVEVAQGAFDEKEFIIFTEDDPVSTDGKNRFQEGINAWISTNGDPKYHPPGDTSTARSDTVAVNIYSPEDHKRYDTNDIKIDANAFSSNEIIKMEVEIDGSVKRVINDKSINEIFNLSDGPHTIRVRAFDSKGNSGTGTMLIGVKSSWETTPTPTPSPVSEGD